jgi:hypothetical protein
LRGVRLPFLGLSDPGELVIELVQFLDVDTAFAEI